MRRCHVVLAAALALAPGFAAAGTTTTTYTYNGDGALTAMTVTPDEGAPETTYLTWDNFTPGKADPATGTLAKGNGRLVGMGPEPAAPAAFSFDARDRLTGQGAGKSAQNYDYHASNLLASARLGEEVLQFYQGAGTHPKILNIRQPGANDGSDLWSGRLGAQRYLGDGTEQVLLTPRKDSAGLFSPHDSHVTGYDYDPFGGPAEGFTPATSYDLADNPFRYAGEYQDPVWGGYYLRARWYDPSIAQFISRDPQPHLNRFGYAGGNPVMNIDPGGMKFFQSLGDGLQDADRAMNKGVGGHFARFFLAPVVGVLNFAAYPKAFWEQIAQNKDGIDYFLGASIVVEAISMGTEGFGLSATWRNLSLGTRYGARLVIDSGLSLGQAVAVGANRGFKDFNWSSFAASSETFFGGLAYSRLALGVGYNPYTLKGEDVARMIQDLRATDIIHDANDDTVLIFRARGPYQPWKLKGTSPLAEWRELGNYHERIFAASHDLSAHNELNTLPMEDGTVVTHTDVSERRASPDHYLETKTNMRFQYLGSMSREAFEKSEFTSLNPRGLLTGPEALETKQNNYPLRDRWRYSRYTNNCHNHAQAVLSQLNFR